jgi:hypothetical protein
LLLGEVDPETIPEVPTYEEHIKPLMEYYCVACHYPGSQGKAARDLAGLDEAGAPRAFAPGEFDEEGDAFARDRDAYGLINEGIDPDLSSYEAVTAEFEEVAEEIFEDRTMPPGASRRLNAREELILSRWAALGFPR